MGTGQVQPGKPDYDQALNRLLLRGHSGFLSLVDPNLTWQGELSPELPAVARHADLVWEVGFLRIIDARGRAADGTYWRDLGMFGESVFYRKMDAQTAAVLDRFMDGACLTSRPPSLDEIR